MLPLSLFKQVMQASISFFSCMVHSYTREDSSLGTDCVMMQPSLKTLQKAQAELTNSWYIQFQQVRSAAQT